jgi:hypothetical protein
MSPVVSTRAGASAGAYGWTKLALGGGYWVLRSSVADPRYTGIGVDSSENLYVRWDFVSGSIFYPQLTKVAYDGTIEFSKYYNTNYGAWNGNTSGSASLLSSGNIMWGGGTNSAPNTQSFTFITSPAGAEVSQKHFSLSSGTSTVRGFAVSLNGAYAVNGSTSPSYYLAMMQTPISTTGGSYGTPYESNYPAQTYQIDIANNGATCVSLGAQIYGSIGSVTWSANPNDLTAGGYFNSSNELFGFGYGDNGSVHGCAGKLSLASATATPTWARGASYGSGGSFAGNAFGGTYLYSVYNAYVGGYYRTVVVKRNQSDGALVWQREFAMSGVSLAAPSNYYSVKCIAVDSTDSFMWIQIINQDAYPYQKSYIFKLPTNGGKTGSYTISGDTITYSASSYTDAARTITRNASNVSAFYNGNGVTTTPTLTYANGNSLNATKTIIT